MARSGEQHVVRPPLGPPSLPVTVQFPSLALQPAAADTLSYLSPRCSAALLLPSFVKETRRSELHSQFPSMFAFANANGISIRSLSSSLFSLSFIRRRVTIISTFGYRFCALHPPLLPRSFSCSLPASPPLLGEIDESAPTNRRRTAAFSDNRERKLHLLFLDLERNPQPETRETATYSFYKYD